MKSVWGFYFKINKRLKVIKNNSLHKNLKVADIEN